MRALLPLVLLVAAAPAAPAGLAAPAVDDALRAARAAAATGAAEVLPRLRLARLLHDRGQRLLAFAVVEHVAQEGAEDFITAFHHVFGEGPASLSPEEEASLQRAVDARPDDAAALEALADLYLWRRDFEAAAGLLERAVALDPEDFTLHANLSQSLKVLGDARRARGVLDGWFAAHPDSAQAWARRVQEKMATNAAAALELCERGLALHPKEGSLHGLHAALLQEQGRPAEAEAALRRSAALSDRNPSVHLTLGAIDAERDPSAAREHYLTAYFLDPRAALDVPAATRIKELTFAQGTERFEAEGEGCAEPACFERLLADEDPVVVTMALRAAELNWRPWHVEPVVALLSHDDPDLRGKAVSVLRRRVGEEFRPRLRELLQARDLHARALSAFLAVRLLRADALPVLEAFLASPAQAVRRDALRALASSGLEGSLAAIARHLESETQPALVAEAQRLLAQSRAVPPPPQR